MYILVLNSVYKICLSEPFHKVPTYEILETSCKKRRGKLHGWLSYFLVCVETFLVRLNFIYTHKVRLRLTSHLFQNCISRILFYILAYEFIFLTICSKFIQKHHLNPFYILSSRNTMKNIFSSIADD